LVIIDGQVETVLTADGGWGMDSGDRQVTVSLRPLPKVTQLLPTYPNPFNPETWIPFELHPDANVSLLIFDVRGHLTV
jgi:hypothetical protein